MTDITKLGPMAAAISTSSSRIRAYAIEQARVSGEQETRLRALEGPTPVPVPVPVPVPPSSGIASPVEPSKHTPINLYLAPATLTDYLIDGGGDTPVLVQPGAPGSRLSRIRVMNVGLTPTVTWPIHALYAKALNVTVEDMWASTSANVSGECFSLRMAGAVLRRFHGEGNHAHLISYFEEKQPDGTVAPGSVLCEDGSGSFKGDTAVWVAVNSAPYCAQAFTFRRCNFTGASFFVKADLPTFRGSVRLESCTLNGKPVTTAMTNLPADKLTIT